MRIALITEDSQAEKNEMIFSSLKNAATQKGHEVVNLGMFTEKDDRQLNFVQVGLVASVAIETGIADFIVTGCGTGQGAMITCNGYKNLVCGFVAQPLDAFLFSQVNGGNVISMPLAQNFGWGSELNLDYIFTTLFNQEFGGGYPEIHAEGERKSRIRMQNMKNAIQKDLINAIQDLDQNFVRTALNEPKLIAEIREHGNDSEVTKFVLEMFS